jgi:predicted PurR-regulated permease PerM
MYLVSDVPGPRVMSHSVGINPIVSFCALIAGATLGRMLGAFFAAPILAVLLVEVERNYPHKRHREVPDAVTTQDSPQRQHEPSSEAIRALVTGGAA